MDKKIIYCQSREQWRDWLQNNFQSEKEIYFVFPTVASKEKGVSYNDAVEEALCFGWIDGVANSYDDKHNLRRFTPRRKGSSYSQLNIERLRYLNSLGLIHPSIQKEVEQIISKPFIFPKDIINKIKKDEIAYTHYLTYTDSYKRIRIAYIDSARKRPDEFKKRLNNFIDKCRENKLITTYGGADKYYK